MPRVFFRLFVCTEMSVPKRPRDRALQARVEQAGNIYRLGILSADGWVSAAAIGTNERWAFSQKTSCLAYPVRNKCERICSKGLVLKAPKIFDDVKTQEALEQYWSRDMPQEFLKPVYTYCATVGWCCATIVPDPRFGARPVCVPPTTPGLMLRWNQVGDVQAMLSGDDMVGGSNMGTMGPQGVLSHIFVPLLGSATGALGVVTNTSNSGSLAARDPSASENTFDLKNVPPGFFFPPQHELMFISLSPWDPTLPGVQTPMDPIWKNILFWEETRELWLQALRDRVNRPIFVTKPMALSGHGKNDPLLDTDLTRGDMPECKAPEGPDAELKRAELREQRETARAGIVTAAWNRARNYYGLEPRRILPPSWGGNALALQGPLRKHKLQDGEIVQRTDAYPDMPDTSQIEAHLNEQSCQSYGVPLSLGSRSSDSGQAKLWSTGGDGQSFRMYQQTCAQDAGGLEAVAKRVFVRGFGPTYVISAAIRRMYDQEIAKAKADAANFRTDHDRDGDVRMGGEYGRDALPKGQRKLVTREFDDETEDNGKLAEKNRQALREFENNVEIILLGNIEMSDVQAAADGGYMNYENYRLFLAANARVPLSMLEKQPQDPFRLKVAEKEADIDANAKAKAKAKTAAAGGGSSKK